MEFMLKRKKITYEYSITEKCSFIQACNFINLPRMYDFSKFCFKPHKGDADILKSTYKLISKMTWSQLANVAVMIDTVR